MFSVAVNWYFEMPRRKVSKAELKLAGDVGHRLVEIRSELGLSQQEFVRRLGKGSQQALANYEAGEALVPSGLALRIRDEFDVNLDWLMTGRGPKSWRGFSFEPALSTDLEKERTLHLAGKILTAGTAEDRSGLVHYVEAVGRKFVDKRFEKMIKEAIARVKPKRK